MYTVTIRRAAKINIGNYENTDVEVTLAGEFDDAETGVSILKEKTARVLSELIDEVELKTTKSKSKAGRFGV